MAVKVAVVKQGVNEMLRIGNARAGKAEPVKAIRHIVPLSEVESCGLFGFPKMPGLDRRPTFAQYSGLNEAVATALTYVKAQSTRLMTPIPRLNWFKASWKVDWVAQTWAMTWDSITNQKRKGPKDELTPGLKQVDIKKMRTSSKCKVANAAEDTQTAPEASAGEHMQQPGAEGGDETSVPCVDEASTNEVRLMRAGVLVEQTLSQQQQQQQQQVGSCAQANHVQDESRPLVSGQASRTPMAKKSGLPTGPCAFGCSTSAKRQKGREIWMRIPEPSPWEGIAAGTVICSKHYDRARKMQRDQGLKDMRQQGMRGEAEISSSRAEVDADEPSGTAENPAVAAWPLCVGAVTVDQPRVEAAQVNHSALPKTAKARQGPCVFGCQRSAKQRAGRQVWMGVPRPKPWSDIDDNSVLCSKCYERGLTLIRKGARGGTAAREQQDQTAERAKQPACADAMSTARMASGGGGGINTSDGNCNSVGETRSAVAEGAGRGQDPEAS